MMSICLVVLGLTAVSTLPANIKEADDVDQVGRDKLWFENAGKSKD
jgi:hypothetical protein